jgi:tRNA/tmRNA/rRNA uracil-C5-methylase (TrmA/RlmC/RlmD family)
MAGRLVEVTVGPVAHGGSCVARHEGRVVFVRHALPGERVRVRVTDGHAESRFLRGDAVEILEPSPDRVPPPCPYARPGRCGGCDWQHATLTAQRELKAAVVAEQLRRLAGLDLPVTVEELPGTPDGLGWRTRVQFAVDADGRAGLRKHRSHRVQPIDRCLIASPEVEALGVERRPWPGAARVEAVASAWTGDFAVLAEPAGTAGRHGPARTRDPARVGAPELVAGTPAVRERAAGREWRVTGSGFWQVHPAAADTLVQAVLAGLDCRRDDSALDLYCGVGLFAGALAPLVGEVLGIESDPRAVTDARHNLADLQRVTLEQGRVEDVLDRVGAAAEGGAAGRAHRRDLVVLDPPRSGAGRPVVDRVAALGPRRIAYVACDPAPLARDLAYFAEHGYRLASLRAFDLFPMTAHVECVAHLVAGPA